MNTRTERVSSVSLLGSLRTQTRIVKALLLREVLTRFGRHNLGFLWLFIEPMVFTIGVVMLWTALKSTHGSSLPITAFAITGYSSVLLWRSMPGRCMNAIEPNRALMHHRNVRMMDIYLARILLEVIGVTASLATLTLVFWSIGMMRLPQDILVTAAGWFLLAWFGAALALVLACLALRSELVDKLWHPTSYLLFPLSGAAFLVDWLPPRVREYALLLPMVHCTEMIREGYFGAQVRTYFDPFYVVSVNMAFTLVALALLRDSARRLQPE